MPTNSTIVRFIALSKHRLSSIAAPQMAARQLERLFLTPQRTSRPEREQQWLQGAVSERITWRDAQQLTLYRWGNTGPKVLLMHGFSGRASQLACYAAPLVAKGFQVLAFDAPAHGESDGVQTSLPEFADALLHVGARLGPLHACIAHSNGAAATTLALSRGLDCARTVLLAAPEDLQGYLQQIGRWLGFTQRAIWACQRRIEARYAVPFSELRGALLAPQLRVPALLIHDQEDQVVPISEGQRLANAWPHAELLVTQGLGHSRLLRDEQIIERVQRFICAALPQPACA